MAPALPSVTALALAIDTTEVVASSSVIVTLVPVTVVLSSVTAPVTVISSSSSSRLSLVGSSEKLAWAESAPSASVMVTAPTSV